MIRFCGLFIVILLFIMALIGCGGSGSNGGTTPVSWRLEVTNLPFNEALYYAPSATPGYALRLRKGVDTGSGVTPGALEEVDFSSGVVTRSVDVFDKASVVSVSPDGTQAYVYRLGWFDSGEARIQRVLLSSFTVAATYNAPISTNSFLGELRINPFNPMEIVVIAYTASSGNKVGPFCYRNDALLPQYPPDSPQTPNYLIYVSENTIWGPYGAPSGTDHSAYSVGGLGVSKIQSPNLNQLQGNLMGKFGNALISTSGLILSYPSLSVITDISPQMRRYNMVSIQSSSESQPGWLAGSIPEQVLDITALSPGTWEPVADQRLLHLAGERFYSAVPLKDSSVIIQTSQRKLLVRLIAE